MALGAITVQQSNPAGGVAPIVIGPLKVSVVNIVGDSAYPTGGSSLTPAQLGLGTVLFSQAEVAGSTGSNCAAAAAFYNTVTSKLQCLANSGVEVANTTNLSGITWQILAFGY